MLEIKNAVKEWRIPLMCSSVAEENQQWVWRYINRNMPEWNAKRKNNNKNNIRELSGYEVFTTDATYM